MANITKNINLLEVARGAVMEQIDIEINKIMENIHDPNTDFKTVRTLNIKVGFKANELRDRIMVEAQAKSTLAPIKPIEAMLYTEMTSNGIVAAELTKPDPKQVSIEEEMGTAETNIIQMRRAK